MLEARDVAVMGQPPGNSRLRLIFRRVEHLVERVGLWMAEETQLVAEEPLRYYVVLVERFERLQAIPFMREVDGDALLRPSPSEVQATLVLGGITAAAKAGTPNVNWTPPEPVATAVLRTMDWADVCRVPVKPPQVVAALFLGWRPPAMSLPALTWEPGRLLVKAMVYKPVHAGLHHLADLGVAPLTTLRCKDRAAFATLVAEATDKISLSLFSPRQDGRRSKALADWNYAKRSLWEVLANLVVGKGQKGKRPQAGAYGSSLLGEWATERLGVKVGPVQRSVCVCCGSLHADARCPQCPSHAIVVTARRNQFFTPKEFLIGDDVDFGYQKVRFKRCHTPDCEKLLEKMTGIPGLWAIYPVGEPACPRCHSTTRRTVTVWARQP